MRADALARFPTALILATIASMLLVAPVAAECTIMDRWPSFTEVAPGADTILLGRVAESLQEDSAAHAIRFRVDVMEVLRGSAPRSFEVQAGTRFADVMERCDDSMLRAQVGEVLAMAFAGHPTASVNRVAAVAWVEGRPNAFSMPGAQKLSERQVRAIAALPPTDTDLVRPAGQRPERDLAPEILLVAMGALGVLAIERRRRVGLRP
jgi:hypothetical protein